MPTKYPIGRNNTLEFVFHSITHEFWYQKLTLMSDHHLDFCIHSKAGSHTSGHHFKEYIYYIMPRYLLICDCEEVNFYNNLISDHIHARTNLCLV
ncbi:hypothetical protein VNO77_35410 [Canavalia gladiata]|uniref:Uncharacterized protein n=1 Tax=Canavalia gladiata TaxID=3824 RepID=A0AAN9PZQ0_CANGL